MYHKFVGIFNLIFDEDIELETLIVCVAILNSSGVNPIESCGEFAN